MTRQDRYEYVELSEFFFPLLRDSGDSPEMNVDGSITPVVFGYTVPQGFDFLIHSTLLTLVDNAAMNADEFGGIAGGLDNGIIIRAVPPGGDPLAPVRTEATVRVNGDFAVFANDVQQLSGNRGLSVSWPWVADTGGLPVRLPPKFQFIVVIRDDLTGLVRFRAGLHGLLIDEHRTSKSNIRRTF